MMNLHANWDHHSLILWTDDGIDPASLRDLVGEISSDSLIASVAQETTIRLRLPRSETSELVDVKALRLSPSESIDWLLSLGEDPPAVCSDSIRYWRNLARYVADHLRREQFYPSIAQRDEHFDAAWRILVGGRQQTRRLEEFAGAMPKSCRAFSDEPDVEPLALVDSFLSATTDALVRRSAGNDPFFARVHALAHENSSPIEVRWLSALLGEDRTVRGEQYELAGFADQVRSWLARLDETGAGSRWQLVFDLEEPSAEDESTDPWRVVFLLRPVDVDGTTIDASEIWAESNGSIGLIGRNTAERREFLIDEIRRATEFFPPLARLADAPAPAEIELSPSEAHLFMRRWSSELKDRAFGVTLPDWASSRQRTVELVMSLRPMDADFPLGSGRGGNGLSTPFEVATGRMALDSVLNFDWQVAVGDLELSPQEFQRLVEQQSPLIRHRGQWVEVDAVAADAAAKYLEEKNTGRMTLSEAFRTAFGLSRSASDPSIRLSGSSWVSQLLEQTPAMQMQNVPQPEEFIGTLRPYQLRGLQWLTFLDQLGIGACLADDMGLGKTIQLIALLLRDHRSISPSPGTPGEGRGEGSLRSEISDLKSQNPNPLSEYQQSGPTLLFAPTSVVGNWVKELQRFAPKMRVLLHHGPERPRGDAFIAAAERYDLVITSYALAHRDLADLTRIGWHRIALDEAQKIKNASSAASVAIRALAAPHRVALTGTPIENHLSELWSIMDMLNPGLLGTAREFRERFAVPIEKLADKQRSAHLRRMIRPFVLRRTKTDPELAGDLPEKMEMKVYCNLTTEQAAMYERITAEMLGQIDEATGIRRRGLILAVLTRLKQLCNHPMLLTKDSGPIDGRSGKCERLADMLEEVLEEGESALVFTQYREMGHLLEKLLQQRLKTPTLFLHGGTPQKRRDEMVQEFQTPETDKRVFILSLRGACLGLNLTAASHVFHFDRWWNPAVESQATDRAHRIGQNRKVQVHKFVAMGTVEERIDKMLTEKLQLADQIVGSGDEWLTSLSTSDLREYLKLSEETVGEF